MESYCKDDGFCKQSTIKLKEAQEEAYKLQTVITQISQDTTKSLNNQLLVYLGGQMSLDIVCSGILRFKQDYFEKSKLNKYPPRLVLENQIMKFRNFCLVNEVTTAFFEDFAQHSYGNEQHQHQKLVGDNMNRVKSKILDRDMFQKIISERIN
ncbi:hypothetical protein ABPG74_007881 [Tetrahymena malaccensis]